MTFRIFSQGTDTYYCPWRVVYRKNDHGQWRYYLEKRLAPSDTDSELGDSYVEVAQLESFSQKGDSQEATPDNAESNVTDSNEDSQQESAELYGNIPYGEVLSMMFHASVAPTEEDNNSQSSNGLVVRRKDREAREKNLLAAALAAEVDCLLFEGPETFGSDCQQIIAMQALVIVYKALQGEQQFDNTGHSRGGIETLIVPHEVNRILARLDELTLTENEKKDKASIAQAIIRANSHKSKAQAVYQQLQTQEPAIFQAIVDNAYQKLSAKTKQDEEIPTQKDISFRLFPIDPVPGATDSLITSLAWKDADMLQLASNVQECREVIMRDEMSHYFLPVVPQGKVTLIDLPGNHGTCTGNNKTQNCLEVAENEEQKQAIQAIWKIVFLNLIDFLVPKTKQSSTENLKQSKDNSLDFNRLPSCHEKELIEEFNEFQHEAPQQRHEMLLQQYQRVEKHREKLQEKYWQDAYPGISRYNGTQGRPFHPGSFRQSFLPLIKGYASKQHVQLELEKLESISALQDDSRSMVQRIECYQAILQKKLPEIFSVAEQQDDAKTMEIFSQQLQSILLQFLQVVQDELLNGQYGIEEKKELNVAVIALIACIKKIPENIAMQNAVLLKKEVNNEKAKELNNNKKGIAFELTEVKQENFSEHIEKIVRAVKQYYPQVMHETFQLLQQEAEKKKTVLEEYQKNIVADKKNSRQSIDSQEEKLLLLLLQDHYARCCQRLCNLSGYQQLLAASAKQDSSEAEGKAAKTQKSGKPENPKVSKQQIAAEYQQAVQAFKLAQIALLEQAGNFSDEAKQQLQQHYKEQFHAGKTTAHSPEDQFMAALRLSTHQSLLLAKENAELERQIQQLQQQQSGAFGSQEAALKQGLEELDQATGGTHERIDELEKQLTALRQTIEQKDQQIAELEKKLSPSASALQDDVEEEEKGTEANSLNSSFKQLEERIRGLHKKNAEQETKIQELQKQLEVLQPLVEKLKNQHQAEIEQLKNQHQAESAQLKNQIQAKTEQLENQHQVEIEQLKDQYQAESAQLKNQIQAKTEQLENQHQVEIEQLKDQYQAESAQLKNQIQAKTEQLENQHQVEIEQLKDQYQVEIEQLKDQYQAESAQLKNQQSSLLRTQTIEKLGTLCTAEEKKAQLEVLLKNATASCDDKDFYRAALAIVLQQRRWQFCNKSRSGEKLLTALNDSTEQELWQHLLQALNLNNKETLRYRDIRSAVTESAVEDNKGGQHLLCAAYRKQNSETIRAFSSSNGNNSSIEKKGFSLKK